MATEGNPKVSIVYNSEKLIKYGIQHDDDFKPFIRLQADSSKHFENFKLGSQVRSSTEVTKTARSSTMLTYLSVNAEGVYGLLQEKVACETCSSKIRRATIASFPNGEAH